MSIHTVLKRFWRLPSRQFLKRKAMDKDVPVTIIWDSVAATSPKGRA